MLIALLAFFLTFCDKNEDTSSSADPSNLTVEILSVDQESGLVVIQASAQNAVSYALFLGDSDLPVIVNESGYFEYTFQTEGQYTIQVRAYGPSGRYVKASRIISLSPGGVPLDKGYFTPMEYEGYTLIWQDEFDGATIDPDSWNFETGDGCPNNCGWGNNELEYYRTQNAWEADDVLIIEARKESYQNRFYTSARMTTKGKVLFRYGRVDIRALLPEGQGIWPALWLLGNNVSSVGWPKCGEIDIMEMIGGSGRENRCYGTVHWDNGEGHASYGDSHTLSSGTFADAYHVFTLTWDAASIKWYVDDKLYNTVNITGPDMTEFHQEFFVIFNVAVGGNWPGNPDNSTVFPQQMRVDYVRIFQQN